MSGSEDDDRREREDALFQEIIEQYGSRPDFPEPPATPTRVQADPGAAEDPVDTDDGEHFVPAPVPPVSRPHGIRAVAWFGVFGVPAIVLVCLLAQISLPSWFGLVFLAWFVGGFGYLVATMNARDGDPDNGWDNGAVL